MIRPKDGICYNQVIPYKSIEDPLCADNSNTFIAIMNKWYQTVGRYLSDSHRQRYCVYWSTIQNMTNISLE